MKNWQKKVLAVVLAVALIVTGFATSTFMDGNSNKVVKETTVSKTNDNKSDVTQYPLKIPILKSLKSLMYLTRKVM